jgi:hypothetical protein
MLHHRGNATQRRAFPRSRELRPLALAATGRSGRDMRAPDRLGALAQGCGFVALVLVIPERGSAGRLSGSARPMERAKKVKEAPPSADPRRAPRATL